MPFMQKSVSHYRHHYLQIYQNIATLLQEYIVLSLDLFRSAHVSAHFRLLQMLPFLSSAGSFSFHRFPLFRAAVRDRFSNFSPTGSLDWRSLAIVRIIMLDLLPETRVTWSRMTGASRSDRNTIALIRLNSIRSRLGASYASKVSNLHFVLRIFQRFDF